jgi:hypothetical protein
MSENLMMARSGFSGSAIAALVAGVMSIASIAALPAAILPLGVVALVLGLLSRRALRADLSLRGARLSLAGFILGLVGMFLGGAVPLLLVLLLRLLGWSD